MRAMIGRSLLLAITMLTACPDVAPTATGSGAKTLTSIRVSPEALVLAKGGSVQLAALAVFADSTVEGVTATATFSVGSAEVLSVSTTEPGLVTGLAAGTSTALAARAGVTGSITVTVTALSVSQDNVTFTEVAAVSAVSACPVAVRTVAVPAPPTTTARYFRLLLTPVPYTFSTQSDGDPLQAQRAGGLTGGARRGAAADERGEVQGTDASSINARATGRPNNPAGAARGHRRG